MGIGVLTYKRYTGQLTGSTQQQRAAEMKRRIDKLIPHLHIFEQALKEEFFVPDEWKRLSPIDYVHTALTYGQIMAIHEDGRMIGFHLLYNMLPFHRAGWGMFLLSEVRGRGVFEAAAAEILNYAFDDGYEKGLQLIKLNLEVCKDNVPAIRALNKLEALSLVGERKLEGFFNGQPSDMLLYEIYHPKLRGEPDDRIRSTELCSTTELQRDDSASGNGGGLGQPGVASECGVT